MVSTALALLQVEARRQPAGRLLARGTVVFWQQGRPFGDPRLLSRYRPRGGGWGPTVRLDEKKFVQLGPAQAVVDPSGSAVVTWDEERQSRCCAGRVRVATYVPGTGWSVDTLFQRSNHSHQPQIDLADDGTVTVAWADYDKILVAHRSAAGVWSSPEQVFLLGDSAAPDLVGVGTTDAGGTVVGWTRLDLDSGRRGDVLSVQASPGAPWSRERVSKPEAEPFFTPFFPTLAVDEDGGATMTWQVQTSDPRGWYRVFARHRLPDGTWEKPVRLGRVDELGEPRRRRPGHRHRAVAGRRPARWRGRVLLDRPVAGAAGGIVRTGRGSTARCCQGCHGEPLSRESACANAFCPQPSSPPSWSSAGPRRARPVRPASGR